MISINSLLEKFKQLSQDSTHRKETIIDIIQQTTGMTLETKALSENNKTLFIQTHPTGRSEIFLHKEKILGLLKDQKIFFSDIR